MESVECNQFLSGDCDCLVESVYRWSLLDSIIEKSIVVTYVYFYYAIQKQYCVTHQCFYSKRSLYLVVFRLQDEENGVYELDGWLREIQV